MKKSAQPVNVKCILLQLLKAVSHYHQHKCAHGSLSPSSVLVVGPTNLKIVDDAGRIGSPSYKAPELLLYSREHSLAADIWSVGCLFAEMIFGKPIFPGRNEHEEMVNMVKLIGAVNYGQSFVEGLYDYSTNEHMFNFLIALERMMVKDDGPIDTMQPIHALIWYFMSVHREQNIMQLSKVVTNLDRSKGLALLMDMLCLNPKKRITVDGALKHPYLKDVAVKK